MVTAWLAEFCVQMLQGGNARTDGDKFEELELIAKCSLLGAHMHPKLIENIIAHVYRGGIWALGST